LNSISKLVVALSFCSVISALGVSQVQSTSKFDAATTEAKASNGDVAAMLQLGRAYWGGDGVTADVEKGSVWLDRAAEKGSAEAKMLLGAAYLSGTKLSKNRELAAKYLLQVAQQQHVDDGFKSSQALAQYWVAMMYEQGAGVEKSHEKAIQSLQLAASNGNYPAQYDLGSLYNEGTGGMTMDKARACELFEKAAEQGHVMAMHNAGYCYQVGISGKKDESKAINYYTKAAEAGSARSQRNLGILFGRSGQPEKAYFWLRVAESSGDAESKPFIDKLKPMLPSAQVEAQEKEVVFWLNAHLPKKQ
jgi:TPR repeat protein